MEKRNWLTETEKMTLKHLLGFSNQTIMLFEDLDLDDASRQFIIFNMMVQLKEREHEKIKKTIHNSLLK